MDLKVVTFNIRLDKGWDKGNNWEFRKPLVKGFFDKAMADIYCLQEVLPHVKIHIQEMLGNDYFCFGMGRDEHMQDESCYICINKKRLELLACDNFAVSYTPNVIGSKISQEGVLPRICTHSLIRDNKTGKVFRVFNTHLEHSKHELTVAGLNVVLEQIEKINSVNNFSTILCGDFNLLPKFTLQVIKESKTLLRDVSSIESLSVDYTYHGFYNDKLIKIDYVLVTKDFELSKIDIDVFSKDNVYLSDHFPVITKLKL